jgi:hypothetical protein
MYPGVTEDSLPERIDFNPGGLAVVWAEENTREALFAAMRRREAYATSGPRIELRFFGGPDLAEGLCGGDDFARAGYASGVAMGGRLSGTHPQGSGGPSGAKRAPAFAVRALKDPGSPGRPGGDLARIQIIKGWVEAGRAHETVFEVAGSLNSDANIDLESCEARAPAHSELCGEWRDPNFDPAQPAFYYARVLESPSCRWSTWVCNAKGVDCSRPEEVPRGLRDCCDTSFPRTIQERAWSSPIWYSP